MRCPLALAPLWPDRFAPESHNRTMPPTRATPLTAAAQRAAFLVPNPAPGASPSCPFLLPPCSQAGRRDPGVVCAAATAGRRGRGESAAVARAVGLRGLPGGSLRWVEGSSGPPLKEVVAAGRGMHPEKYWVGATPRAATPACVPARRRIVWQCPPPLPTLLGAPAPPACPTCLLQAPWPAPTRWQSRSTASSVGSRSSARQVDESTISGFDGLGKPERFHGTGQRGGRAAPGV